MTDQPYVLRSSPSVGEVHSGVRIDEAGNFLVVTHGKPKALAASLRLLADEIEDDLAVDAQWGGNAQLSVAAEVCALDEGGQ